MKTTAKAILLAVLVLLAVPMLAMPSQAWADPTPDEYFIEELKARGIPRPTSDAEAIKTAHSIVELLVANPTMDEVGVIGNALLEISAERGAPMTRAQAGTYVRLSVHYYGPQWLGETLDQQAHAP